MPKTSVDYEELYRDRDRSWSLRIVDRLKEGIDKKELKAILNFVDTYDDHRMEAPVTRILEDSSLSESVRDHASQVLCHLSSTETATQRREWWLSDDHSLMRHAIRVAQRSEPDEASLIEKLVGDPTNNFHGNAIEALSFGFPEARFQSFKIAALSHADSSVRKKAAKALYWDQPVCAELALLAAAMDSCDDVAIAALDALCWYTSKNVLLKLHELRCSGRPELLDCYNRTFKWVLEKCLDDLCFYMDESEAFNKYLSWLEPLWSIMSYCHQAEENPDDDSSKTDGEVNASLVCADKSTIVLHSTPTFEEVLKPSVTAIIEDYSNPDNPRKSWEHGRYDWNQYSESEQSELIKFFLASPDYLVRRLAARAFVEWNASDALLRLVCDPVHVVRRYACYVAKELSPNDMIKEALYKTFNHSETTDSFASETLESYIIHAEGPELDQWLLHTLMTDSRESIRQSLVWTLATRNSALLTEAFPLLYAEPLLTWEVHAALLDRYIDFALPTADLAPLMAIDDFEVQKNLARLLVGPQVDA